MRSLTFIEVDVPEFTDTASPIAEETFRFAKPAEFLPRDITAFPAIAQVSFTPARISLGENLGERAALDVSFDDFQHIFDAEDFDAGSFFGKWRARNGLKVISNSLRWYQGDTTQALAEMTERHFIIEGAEGPSLDGKYRLTAKDIIKFADSDRAQAPAVSSGFLTSDISDSDTSVTLSPAGIGDAEYPASGYVAIGGKEICAFTRSGDTLTLETFDESPSTSGRGKRGTTATSHDSGDRVQLVLVYDAVDPADIIRDLVVNYTDIPASYVNLADWKSETENYLQRLYTATIPEPTGVAKLIAELVEQAALAIWDDLTGPSIRLQVLREISTDAATFDDRNVIEGSLGIKEQPGRRLSQVWTFFGQRNPLEPLDEPSNFRSVAVSIDSDAETDYGQPRVKRIFSRWIPFGARAVAERLNDILLSRFRDPPRRFTFQVARGGEITPALGGGYLLSARPIQTTAGERTTAPIQITRLNPRDDLVEVTADEMLFQAQPVDLVNRTIVIDADDRDLNGRDLHDQIYPAPTGSESPAISVTFIIQSNVVVGSTDTGTPAFDSGDWPAGIDIDVRVRGRIQGKGGDAPNADSDGENGNPGGTALTVRVPIDLLLDEGDAEIWSGGGSGAAPPDVQGGGVGGPGGGAGDQPGLGGENFQDADPGEDGTREAGGKGGGGRRGGGDGGDPGQDGETKFGVPGGSAGAAIDGLSNVTKTGVGDIKGDEIN